MLWHNIDKEKVLKEINSDSDQGLFSDEVEKRQKRFGKNVLAKEKPLSKLKLVLNQFKSPLIYVLVIAGIVVLFFKEFTDAVVIFGAVILNTSIGFIQENKANRSLRQLRKAVEIKCKVVRGGHAKIISYKDLTIGDIVVLEAGDKVPADGRILEEDELKINEMVLTGEWLPASKKTRGLKEDTPVPDRDNMAYMGTIVEAGRGKFVVTAIGSHTETGKVARMVKEAEEDMTPLQKKISRFAKIVGGIIAFISVVILVEGLITGNSFIEMFTVAIAVAVSAIPEGLPVAVTVILAMGMQKILKKKGLVRKLLAAETLGGTSVICTDKTLSLTEGKMMVSEIFTENLDNIFALKIASSANEAFIENPEDSIRKWIVRGRPTDKGLLIAAIEAGIDKTKLENKNPKIADLPFNSKNKFIASLNKLDSKKEIIYISGAPEKILKMSKFFEAKGKKKRLNKNHQKKIEKKLDEMTSKGLRVVAVAYKKTKGEREKIEKASSKDKNKELQSLCQNIVFVGLLGLKDPLREGVKKAIKTVRRSGMKPIIVTGDHRLTAKAVGREIGIRAKEENIIEGKELDKISDKDFKKRISDIEIYARAEPRHKMRIVQAWQEKGEVVAMTGDGINDAPALKKADIGVALGSGTEVAKEVSDLIILNDNFNVIVAAVEEGRKILDNVRKVITYLLSDSFTEIILVSGSLLAGFPLPVTAVQILWVNIIEDGLPGISLAFEPKEKDIMKRKPQGNRAPLLTREMKAIIFIIGLVTDIILLGLFFWLWKNNHDLAYVQTMIFGALSIDSLFYVFSCKSLRRNLWHFNPFSNSFLVFSWIVGIVLLLGAIYLLPLQKLLGTVPLRTIDLAFILGLGAVKLALIEFTKWLFIVRHKT